MSLHPNASFRIFTISTAVKLLLFCDFHNEYARASLGIPEWRPNSSEVFVGFLLGIPRPTKNLKLGEEKLPCVARLRGKNFFRLSMRLLTPSNSNLAH